ncbi:MAG: ABC transporter ATP-binding protein [Bacillota bacterium]
MEDCILKMEHITKVFGSFVANDDISLELNKGEVLTLLGENGAGKSTLMNVLSGLYHPTSGKIYIDGQLCTINSPADAAKLGIGMVHQHFMLIDAMTVFQNIILGMSETGKGKRLFIREKQLRKDIAALSEKYGLDVDFDANIPQISVGAQQRVEILKALWRGANILILDEPTAVLTDQETEGLFSIIRKLTGEGKSVIFISHKLREVIQISDRIMVLRHGKCVGSIDSGEVDEQSLANTMVGRQLVQNQYEKSSERDQILLDMKHIHYNSASKHNGLRDITLAVHKGEIFGIAGVDGNGQSELAQIVTGLIAPDSGSLSVHGKEIGVFSPKLFIENGISHVPEDRNRMGLVGDMTIKENLIMKNKAKDRFTKYKGWGLNKKIIEANAQRLMKKYDIRCTSSEQTAQQLSGGNQQKVILARELEAEPKLLVAAHPTRGLDIGATTYIHDQMISARDQGCAILLISADIAEILLMSDRIAVLYEGSVMGIYDGKNPPIEEISLAMAGRKQGDAAGA